MASRHRNKVGAGLLAIFLGTIGAHKVYLDKFWQWVIYILIFWTGIPTILGLIEGIIYLNMDNDQFEKRYD